MGFKLFKKRKMDRIEEVIGENNHQIEKEERDMIRGIFELGETMVKSIMVPRTDVVAVPVDDDPEEIIKTVVKSGHSRVPVYEETIDNVIGFLYVKDLLAQLVKNQGKIDIRKLLRPVLYVPEGKMIDELLKEFRQKKMHIAIVVDEYGGMAGIVCLEDILEEIVGDIQDEYDNEEEEIKKIEENTYICDARILIPELNRELNINLPADSSDTLGGFVFNLFGKIPSLKETISYNGIEFTVEKMEGHKIKKIKLYTSPHEKKIEKQDKQQHN